MKFLSNEVRVGILAVLALALSFWGYQFIRGKNVLKLANTYYVEYENVSLLKVSTPVAINGVQVGFVSAITPVQEKNNVLVTLTLDKGVVIPKSTVAEIRAEGFMGGKSVTLFYTTPCSGPDCAKTGDFIQGKVLGMVGSMVSPGEMTLYMEIIKNGLQQTIDTLNQQLLSKDAQGPLAESMRDLQGALANLEGATGHLNGLLANSSGDIQGSLKNLRSVSQNIEASNAKISSLIANAEQFSQQLDQVNLQKTMAELDQTLAGLKTTIQTADKTFTGINTVVADIQNGKGSLGKLLQDDGLYEDLGGLSSRADSLITDFQDRPYRYMPLKSRIKVKRFDKLDAKEAAKTPEGAN